MRKPLLNGLAVALVLALGLAMAGTAMAQKTEAPGSFTELPPDAVGGANAPGRAPSSPTATLVFYTDRALFQAENAPLTLEDFSGTNLAAGAISACSGPLNSSTNDACFSPGAIVDGIELDTDVPAEDTVGVIPPALDLTCNAFGANTFTDGSEVNFIDPAITVFSVGFDYVCPLAPATVTIDIHAVDGTILGSDTSPCGLGGNFWGVASDEQLGWIHTTSPDAELYCNIEFGESAVPTTTEWGLILLVTILLGISTFFMYRRRSV